MECVSTIAGPARAVKHLAKAGDDHLPAGLRQGYVAAASKPRPIWHHDLISLGDKNVPPSLSTVGRREIAGAGVRATMDHHHRRLGGACYWGEHLVVCGRMIDAVDGVGQRRARWQSHGISAGHAADCAAE